jgi:hypothetical protein
MSSDDEEVRSRSARLQGFVEDHVAGHTSYFVIVAYAKNQVQWRRSRRRRKDPRSGEESTFGADPAGGETTTDSWPFGVCFGVGHHRFRRLLGLIKERAERNLRLENHLEKANKPVEVKLRKDRMATGSTQLRMQLNKPSWGPRTKAGPCGPRAETSVEVTSAKRLSVSSLLPGPLFHRFCGKPLISPTFSGGVRDDHLDETYRLRELFSTEKACEEMINHVQRAQIAEPLPLPIWKSTSSSISRNCTRPSTLRMTGMMNLRNSGMGTRLSRKISISHQETHSEWTRVFNAYLPAQGSGIARVSTHRHRVVPS